MDVRINAAQVAELWRAQRARSTNPEVYTNIPGQTHYHYSWHPNFVIVVGIGAGPGFHMNFRCTIDRRFRVTLAPQGGRLQVGGVDATGRPGINQADLSASVTSKLKSQFRLLCRTREFNALGRSGQRLSLANNEVQNRHDHRQLVIDNQVIRPGHTQRFASTQVSGFAIVRNLAGEDTYYRNYDIREAVSARSNERIRVSQPRAADAAPLLDGTFSGDIRIELLG